MNFGFPETVRRNVQGFVGGCLGHLLVAEMAEDAMQSYKSSTHMLCIVLMMGFWVFFEGFVGIFEVIGGVSVFLPPDFDARNMTKLDLKRILEWQIIPSL